MATRTEVVEEARSWLGTPFKHQAGVKGAGTDCLQLVINVADATGLLKNQTFDWAALPEYHGYGHSPAAYKLVEGCARFLQPIDRTQVLPGDLILMDFGMGPQHFAFLTEMNPPYILHSYAPNRKVVEHILDDQWMKRIVSFHRYPNITD